MVDGLCTDSIVTGRRFRALVIIDDYSRECPVIEVDTSLGGARVVSVLERLAETRGLSEVITRPGKPIENAYAESFIGRLRDECLNENWFISLRHARGVIESWRIGYNERRPHTSLGGLTPREYVEYTGKVLTAGCLQNGVGSE